MATENKNDRAGKSYEDLSLHISNVCVKYGYTQCNFCPLVSACSAERDLDNGESQEAFTKRWEQAMAEEFVKQFPNAKLERKN